MSKVQCFGCNEFGNYKRDCPKDHKNKNNNESKEISESHIAKDEEDEKKPKIEDNKELYY